MKPGDLTARPRRWDIRFIRRFMIVFGLVSSVFDYLTFGALVWLGATIEEFRTRWITSSASPRLSGGRNHRHPLFRDGRSGQAALLSQRKNREAIASQGAF